MSSGFVPGGTIDEPTQRDDEWRRAQQELEDERRRKAELGKQNDGKSLYEVLQQNKMAKQEAFEESIRLKNQFRSLDEDEVEFLDSLLESTRAKEAAVKKETAEHLAAYQRQREEAERALIEGPSGGQSGSTNPTGDEEQWAVAGRKRKRNKKDFLIPPKIRKSSSAIDDTPITSDDKGQSATSTAKSVTKDSVTFTSPSWPARAETVSVEDTKSKTNDALPLKDSPKQKPAVGPSLGLVAYDSDEDSD
ncbi:hypothetical protein EYB25_008097 [Talaromyces marneffei]|uniref:FAM192A/Fyv6 N-terminal domain-containing protein n=1 Tax=Talaromyces marneffei (strain ATCC 18224 / CBS 334.59 / QM 7333) TaxID=441960 RepID=B6QRX4_TALMQ|nr:uncharacterized protein EYB26_003157 [Talaromyces marneffei]EEA20598.1 conserved hypothetical protein [Talaromyces marneffei ATCC 18224]KAE8549575.1 hypothetical protein EYB25_008097 [Talaromyces marneffei]QGA15499.1 hypothetical protein EYB26_003157 [Talaromyces marneffei]